MRAAVILVIAIIACLALGRYQGKRRLEQIRQEREAYGGWIASRDPKTGQLYELPRDATTK